MSSARPFTEHLRVNAYSVIANSQAEQPVIVPNLGLDLFRERMSESVSEDLAANTIDLVRYCRRQGLRFSFHYQVEDGAVGIRIPSVREFLSGGRKQMRQVNRDIWP